MREIKFRAWYRNGERSKMVTGMSNSEIFYRASINPYTLMPYTGLKDKNGVEVYEGDIVTVKQPAARFTETGTVMWHPKKTGYEVRAINPFYKNKFITRSLYNASIEVIGNRYENPELLNTEEE